MEHQSLAFEVVANASQDTVFLLNSSGAILWVNQAGTSVAGRSSESLVGLKLADILTPRSAEAVEAFLRSRPHGGQPTLTELDICRRDLSSCRLEVSLGSLSPPEDSVFLVIGRDVSARRFLDEAQRRADFQTLQFQSALLELARTESSCMQDFLVHVTALAASTLDVARASVWVYNDTQTEMRCAHLFDRERNLHESGAILEVQYYPSYFEGLQEQRTIAASDIQMDRLTRELADYLTTRGIRSVLAVSIREEGKAIGMLVVAATGEPRHWKIDEQNFVASLADLTALALQTDRRRRAERDLRKSLGNLELFFSQSLDGFFFMMLDEPVRWGQDVDQEAVLDYVFAHQHITKINEAMLAQYGAAEAAQFLGRTPHDLFAHDLAQGRDLWRRMFDAGRIHVESDERRLDGSRMWVDGDYICFYDSERRITGHFGIQRDVTERKRAEEALFRFNQRLKLLQQTDRAILAAHSIEDIANAAVAHIREVVPCRRASVVVFDTAAGLGRVVRVRTSGETQVEVGTEIPLETFGDLEQLRLGKAHIVADADQVAGQEAVRLLRQEDVRSFVNIPLVADNCLIGTLNLGSDAAAAFSAEHVEISHEVGNSLAVAIRHAQLNRQIQHHAEVLEQRVTERTAELSGANAQLKDSENRLASIFRSAMDAIVVIDQQRRIVIFNQAAEQMFGCSASEVVSQSIDPFLSEEFLRVLEKCIATTDSSDKGRHWIPEGLMATRKNGERFPIEATASRTTVAGAVLLTMILRDINERKLAEERLDRLQRQNVYLQEELKTEFNFEELVGSSAVMQKVFRGIEMVAETDSTVLLMGETGTGKELIARALHNRSRRRQNVMVKVNCAALPASLVESELFGHEKGAFTGALSQKKGRFEVAHQGTLFLDEVGELPLETQTKLLRVLQEQEFERLGGSETLSVDVRVIAATNRALAEEVRRGTFRADLFYRLNVFPIEVPPLRERKEDIRPMAEEFVRKSSQRMGKRIRGITRDAVERLESYDWPGNVRELANIIERAVILCEGAILNEHYLTLGDEVSSRVDRFPTLEQAERGHILRALQRTGWVLGGPQGAAALLGMNRSTLWSRMRKLGIEGGKSQSVAGVSGGSRP